LVDSFERVKMHGPTNPECIAVYWEVDFRKEGFYDMIQDGARWPTENFGYD
jgi:hypothetical protein